MSLAFNRDGSRLATGGWELRVRFWDTKTWTEINPATGHRGPVESLCYGGDGRTLISTGLDGTLRVWDWPAGRELKRVEGLGSYWGITALAASPDRKTLLSFEQDPTNGPYRLWDFSGKQLARFGTDSGGTAGIAFSRDGRTILTGRGDGSINLWDASNHQFLKRVGKSTGVVYAIAALPDVKQAVWAGEGQAAAVRDLESGNEVRRFTGSLHNSGFGFAVTADGTLLAIAEGNNPVRLWDVASGKSKGGWKSEVQALRTAAFSPDGKLLAVAGANGVQLWDTLTREPLPLWSGHVAGVKSLAFAPDGMTIATGGTEGTIAIWDLTGRLKDGHLAKLALKPEELEKVWLQLSGDPLPALHATWTLTASAETSLPWLATHLRPPARPERERLQRLVADLDNNSFTTREKAERELTLVGESAVPLLRAALATNPSAEARRRLERLLKEFDGGDYVGERLRRLRALAALERIGNRAAIDLLGELAERDPADRLPLEARAALKRLGAAR